MLKNKRRHLILGVGAALVLLLGAVGLVYAQGPQPPADDQPCCGRGLRWGRATEESGAWRGGGHGFSLIDAVAEATGLTVVEITSALEEGQTLAQVVAAEGASVEEVVDIFLADREAALEQAVADGRLSQEQVDGMLENMTANLLARMERPWTPFHGGGRRGGGGLGGGFGRGGSSRWGGDCPAGSSQE